MLKNYNIRFGLIFLIIGFISACAPVHRVVQVSDNQFGATYNNVLIPEYTKSGTTAFAATHEQADSLLSKRAEELNSWIGDKYILPNSLSYRVNHTMLQIGLIAVSPIVIPLEWIGEKVAPPSGAEKGRTFKQVAVDYFELPFDQPVARQVGARVQS